MLTYLTLIFSCQLAGELLVTWLNLPLPGPVLGMALLFVGLVVKGGIPDDLAATASALLGNMSLLFVPAGVGIMLHAALIGREWLPIAASLVVSTGLTIAATALVMTLMTRAGRAARKGGE